jgi:uncharacterized membrane protein
MDTSWIPNAWGASDWGMAVAILLAVTTVVVIWSYFNARAARGSKALMAFMKIAAVLLLAACLLEPMYRYARPEKGANLMVVMADDSQSLQIKDRGETTTREAQLFQKLNDESDWLSQLTEDFDVRKYQFDRRLRPVSNFEEFRADQRGSDILSNLSLAANRFAGRPAAGILLMTDGNATDWNKDAFDSMPWSSMPPVFPVLLGSQRPARDLGITRVSSTQTNFESAPVTITAELMASGYAGKKIVVALLDEAGDEVSKKEVVDVEDGKPFVVRFQTRPERRGVNVFSVKAYAAGEESIIDSPAEATVVNNQRLVLVDRGRGPFRLLYVTGRPNWELKFLRRSLQDDDELDLVALVRIAKREAKFTFRGRDGQQSNSLFRGFDSQDEDTTEQHDEPVFIRLGTRDKEELRGGFPKDAETLFEYDAIVIDDLEADFFTEDQKSLLQQFVSFRGGGLLMLGGQESFVGGDYGKTQIGEMLPVYLDRLAPQSEETYALDLTREGWLQPWVRIESTEEKERLRLAAMPKFKTVNLANSIKPGATVLATVTSGAEKKHPALVVQPYGRGRTGALLIGDFWRWQLKSGEGNEDLLKAWRQTLRWAIADVPRRVEVEINRLNDANRSSEIKVFVNDEAYRPFDNATVVIKVQTPDGKTIELAGEPTDTVPGVYVANFISGETGVYRASVAVNAADGSEIETRESGWISEPDSEEFQSLEPNLKLMKEIAEQTGGQVIDIESLEQFVAGLDYREVPVMETVSTPWWHRWTVFSLAIGLLIGEWGLRRWRGLA